MPVNVNLIILGSRFMRSVSTFLLNPVSAPDTKSIQSATTLPRLPEFYFGGPTDLTNMDLKKAN